MIFKATIEPKFPQKIQGISTLVSRIGNPVDFLSSAVKVSFQKRGKLKDNCL